MLSGHVIFGVNMTKPIDVLRNSGHYTDHFLDNHVGSIGYRGYQKHRLQKDKNAKGSTTMSPLMAHELWKGLRDLRDGKPSRVSRVPGSQHLYDFRGAVVMNHDSQGNSRLAQGTLRFGENENGQIHHIHSNNMMYIRGD